MKTTKLYQIVHHEWPLSWSVAASDPSWSEERVGGVWYMCISDTKHGSGEEWLLTS